MTAEDFNRVALADGVIVTPMKPSPQSVYTGGFSYVAGSPHCKAKISAVSEVYRYPDHYAVVSRNYNPVMDTYGINTKINTESAAYSLLYKIFYEPDTITYDDVFPDAHPAYQPRPFLQKIRTELARARRELEENRGKMTNFEKFRYRVAVKFWEKMDRLFF